eukprot:m.233351 g.233351  ORF g.233351 m.233351 type:complete len:289 (-) comp18899_c0_seq9:78-944(-)
MPVEVVGWRELPNVGDDVIQVNNEAAGRDTVQYRLAMQQKQELRVAAAEAAAAPKKKSKKRGRGRSYGAPEEVEEEVSDGVLEVPIVLKTDVVGSIEAIVGSLEKLNAKTDKVRARVVRSGVGPFTDTDVDMADTMEGRLIGFNVPSAKQVLAKAQNANVNAKTYKVIYDLLDDIEVAMRETLPAVEEVVVVGEAKVQQVFRLTGTKKNTVAGCQVTLGTLQRKCQYRIVRKGDVVHKGMLSALKHFREDVGSVPVNTECGVSFKGFHDVQEGDQLECLEVRMTTPDL